MANKKTCLILGISGQDGSYLAEHLLERGDKVVGLLRRHSIAESQDLRISHLEKDIETYYGDLLDVSSLEKAVTQFKPDEIYNLAAMSHVRISFDLPLFTVQTNALGVANILEVFRRFAPDARFYQASSSEIYGDTVDEDRAQRETTNKTPVSPYGCAKLFSYHLTRNYRKAYGLFASNGVLFNHETLASFMPIIHMENNIIDISPIGDVIRKITKIDENNKEYQGEEINRDIYAWDEKGWTKIKYASAYPHDIENDNKEPRFINSRNACCLTTSSHEFIMDDKSDKKAEDLNVGDRLNVIEYPKNTQYKNHISLEEAEFLGMIVGDGNVYKGRHRIINSSNAIRKRAEDLWSSIGGDGVYYYPSVSGFNPDNIVGYISFNGLKNWIKQFDIYTSDKKKRIPWQVLNSDIDIKESFLKGYNCADGLKSNPCVYEYRNFKTNSATLAAGLIFIIKEVTGQDYNITLESSNSWGDVSYYYSINLLSNSNYSLIESNKKMNIVIDLLKDGKSQREINRETGISRHFIRRVQNGYIPDGKHHFLKDRKEIKKIIDFHDYDGWFYDIETESGTFMGGVGQCHVHNSPRRGANFVSSKIVKAAVLIKLGIQDKLELGNMDTYRDWGHSKDYTKAMMKILEHDVPDDFVIATGETHSVRDMCEYVFKILDMNYKDYVVQNPKFLRPEELPYLKGDPSKAQKTLDWKPEYTFETLLDEMVGHWMGVYKTKYKDKDILV